MKILQINTTVASGSTGRITEDIANVFISKGWESYIAYGRGTSKSNSTLIKIGNEWDVYCHWIGTALFDKHARFSTWATKRLIKKIKEIKPNVIGLHNLHGYYINIEILFKYLSTTEIPIVWTLFDCWAFTGHCTYFDDIQCKKWMIGCFDCPKKKKYPTSFVLDNSKANYALKKAISGALPYVNIVVHSLWLKKLVEASFLKSKAINHIHSGIDLKIFKINTDHLIRDRYDLAYKKIILGVASVWDKRKGLSDFIELSKRIDANTRIILVGLNSKQVKELPDNIIPVSRTESVEELAMFYNAADVFVNPTYLDNFPTTNLEALACGTPIITYKTGGSPEAINQDTGIVVEKGNMDQLFAAIALVLKQSKPFYSSACIARAASYFKKEDRYQEYFDLYTRLINSENV